MNSLKKCQKSTISCDIAKFKKACKEQTVSKIGETTARLMSNELEVHYSTVRDLVDNLK